MSVSTDFNEHCHFPAVVLYRGGDMSIYETLDPLVICRSIDLKAGQRGRFAKATVIDSDGKSWEIDGATVLHGIGLLWGYNILLSRTIRVRPNICSPPRAAELDSVKGEVIKRLSKKEEVITLDLKGFCTTINRAEALRTVRKIEATTSVPEVIATLLAMDFPEKASLVSSGK